MTVIKMWTWGIAFQLFLAGFNFRGWLTSDNNYVLGALVFNALLIGFALLQIHKVQRVNKTCGIQ